MHAHHVPHTEHMESLLGRNGEAQSAVKMMPCCPPPIPSRAVSEVNLSGADTQVVEQLTISLDSFWRRLLSSSP